MVETTSDPDGPTACVEPGGHPLAIEARAGAPHDLTFDHLGRYLVIDEVGRGGMGVVLRAYDPRLQREVALKVVSVEAQSDEARQRMVREARAMARLSHPNVVAVYDVEEDTPVGVVVAMEYVAGSTLREWLGDGTRPWTEVVDALLGAGEGLWAAHREGILHRDFKLDNVLIGEGGRPRVTDFGLARGATGEHDVVESREILDSLRSSDDALRTELTAMGNVLGTPKYMAPEQHAAGELTEAVDQYAFCVAMWRSLTLRWPFEGSGQALVAAKCRAPPPWPRSAPGPARLGEVLRRGLMFEPSKRWPSLRALLDAIGRHRRPRRYATWAAAAGAVAVVAVAAAAVVAADSSGRCGDAIAEGSDVWNDARREALRVTVTGDGADYRVAAWNRIATHVDGFTDAWARQHTEACEATRRGTQSGEALDLRMACLRRAHLALAAAIDVLAMGDDDVLLRAGDVVDGLPVLRQCEDVEALKSDSRPPPPELAEVVAEIEAETVKGNTETRAGRYADAATGLEAALARARTVGHEPLTAQVLVALGRALSFSGDWAHAIEVLREALRASLGVRAWRDARSTAARLAYVIGPLPGRGEEALGYIEIGRGILRAESDLYAEPDPWAQADLHGVAGSLLWHLGRHVEAEAEHRAALAIAIGAYGPEDSSVAVCRNNLGNALKDMGRVREAADEHREALAIRLRTFGSDHPYVASSRSNLANALLELGDTAQAEREFRAALMVKAARLGDEHFETAQIRVNLSVTLDRQGRVDEAEAELRRALGTFRKTLGEAHLYTAVARFNLARRLAESGEAAAAEAEYRGVLGSQIGVLPSDHPHLARVRAGLAELLLEREGGRAEALSLAEAAWAARESATIPATDRAYSAFLVARALGASDDEQRRARALARQALDDFTRADAQTDRREVLAWLETHHDP